MSFPRHIMSFLQHIMSFPRHIMSFPQHNMSFPRHNKSVPWHNKSWLQDNCIKLIFSSCAPRGSIITHEKLKCLFMGCHDSLSDCGALYSTCPVASSTQVYFAKNRYVLLYSPCLFGKELFSMQNKLVNNKQTHLLKQISLTQ